jgi:hypothetical protein
MVQENQKWNFIRKEITDGAMCSRFIKMLFLNYFCFGFAIFKINLCASSPYSSELWWPTLQLAFDGYNVCFHNEISINKGLK